MTISTAAIKPVPANCCGNATSMYCPAAGWVLALTLLVLLVASINFQLNLGYALTFLVVAAHWPACGWGTANLLSCGWACSARCFRASKQQCPCCCRWRTGRASAMACRWR